MKRELRIGLILSVLLLIGVTIARWHFTTRAPEQWDPAFATSLPVSSFEAAATEALQSCDPSKNPADCDAAMENLRESRYHAELFEGGYAFCMERFGRSAEECRDLINSTHSQRKSNRGPALPL